MTAHKNRNQVTSLMYSLTLGFIIFLYIACKLPYYKDYNDSLKGRGFHGLRLVEYNMNMENFDILLKKYDYAIESSGAMTSDLYNLYDYPLYSE